MKNITLLLLLFLVSMFSSGENKTDSVYIVKKGETLWSISEGLFGNGYLSYDLWYYRLNNDFGSPNLIFPGDTFLIPFKTDFIKAYKISPAVTNHNVSNQGKIKKSLKNIEENTGDIADGSFYDFFPFSLLGVCISFIVAIMGIALPMLIQTISKFQERYDSILIKESFESSIPYKWFMWSLKANLVVIGILVILKFFNINLVWLEVVEALFVIIVIVFFFKLIRLIRTFDTPTSLFVFLKNKDKPEALSLHSKFNTIRDLMLYGIRNQNQDFCYDISRFYFDEFDRYRKVEKSVETLYLREHYELIWNLVNELSGIRSNKLMFLVQYTVGAEWIIGDRSYGLSNQSISWIWIYLAHVVRTRNEIWVLEYWKTAHSYLSQREFNIKPEEVSLSENKRKQILRFHLTVGGLIVYSSNYHLLKRMLNYTTTEPPKYFVYPTDIMEIINCYSDFSSQNIFTDVLVYRLPDTDGVNAGDETIKYASHFLGVLFIRQFSYIKGYEVNQDPVADLPIPESQGEKKKYIDQLKSIKIIVNKLFNDNEFLTVFDYQGLKESTLSYIDENLKALEEAFTETEFNQEINPEIKSGYIKNIETITFEGLSEYNKILIQDINHNYSKHFYLKGIRSIMDRAPFAGGQGYSHMNFDTLLQYEALRKYRIEVSEVFLLNRSKKYYLPPSDIDKAVERILIDHKKSDFILVGFGLNIEFLKHDIPTLSDDILDGVELINFEQSYTSRMGQSLFLLAKENLPGSEFQDVSEEEKEKYELEKVENVDINLYGGVSNLNSNDSLREELVQNTTYSDEDLRKLVMASVVFNNKVSWKNEIECIQLELYYDYFSKGEPNKIKDIEPLKGFKSK